MKNNTITYWTEKIIKEITFNLHPEQHSNNHDVLKCHKLTYLNNQIQPMAKEMVLEFYLNAYRPPSKDTAVKPALISWVREKQIQYDWKIVNMLLKMKSREPNYEY